MKKDEDSVNSSEQVCDVRVWNRKFFRVAALSITAAALSACGGGGHGGAIPAKPSGSAQVATTARLLITVPNAVSTASTRQAAYVSASTKSVTIDAKPHGSPTSVAGFPKLSNLAPTSPGCSAVAGGTQCILPILLLPGNFDITVTTFDATGGAGNSLSAAQTVPFNVVQAQTNTLSISLGGVPTSITVIPSGSLTGSVGAGFTLPANTTATATIEGLDADGNVILGSGAPVVGMTSGNTSQLTITGPTVPSPNVVTLTSGALTASVAVTVTVTPASGGGSSALTASTTVGPPAVVHFYIANQGNNAPAGPSFITEYDQTGAQVTPSGGFSLSCTTCQATFLLYVPANGLLYVAEQTTTGGTDAIDAFDLNGNRQTLSGGKFPASSLSDPVGMAYDSANGFIYVVNQGASVTAYDLNGTQQTLTGQNFPVAGLNLPDAIAYNPVSGLIYVANYGGNTINAYDQNGTLQTSSGGFPGLNGPDGLGYDSANGFLYAVNANNNTVTAYNSSGTQQTLAGGAFTSLNTPLAIFYQTSSAQFYVPNITNNTITAYNSNGTLLSLPGAFPSSTMNAPVSIVSAP
jgi:DNA-binding beta-propeller fold protein YncE